jgi:hypothetical protein
MGYAESTSPKSEKRGRRRVGNAFRSRLVAIVAIGFVAAIAFGITVGTLFRDNGFPPCPAPSGVSATSHFENAPPSLALALAERVGEVVPAGASFDATDVIQTGKNRRLFFIWNVGKRWVVATEHGGIGYSNPVFAFDISPGDLRATFVEERVAFPGSLCATASSLLAVGDQNRPAIPPKDVAR